MNRQNVLVTALCGILTAGFVNAAWYSPIIRFGQNIKNQVLQHKKISAVVAALGAGYCGFMKLRDIKINQLIAEEIAKNRPDAEKMAINMARTGQTGHEVRITGCKWFKSYIVTLTPILCDDFGCVDNDEYKHPAIRCRGSNGLDYIVIVSNICVKYLGDKTYLKI